MGHVTLNISCLVGGVSAELVLTVMIDWGLGVLDPHHLQGWGFCPVIFEPLAWSGSRRTWRPGLALALTSCVLVTEPL